jgi:hypothetical protein
MSLKKQCERKKNKKQKNPTVMNQNMFDFFTVMLHIMTL